MHSFDRRLQLAPILNARKGQTACQLSMHRRAVAGVVPRECMSATCFIQVHMCQRSHIKIKMPAVHGKSQKTWYKKLLLLP